MKILITLTTFLFILSFNSIAQNKKVIATKKTTSTVVSPRSFAPHTSVAGIIDIKPEQSSYESLRNLVENHNVTIAFNDNKFRANETLKRGDFIVHFHSALESVNRFKQAQNQDTSLINTYDRNRSYITSVAEIKDIKAGSVYYDAVRSVLEDWGIAAMFKKDKRLNAAGTITEAEVYDILHVTMGYNNAAVSKRAVPIKREAFAVMLAESLEQIKQRIINLPKRLPDVIRDTFYIQKPFDTTGIKK